jgi:hypothetical protein
MARNAFPDVGGFFFLLYCASSLDTSFLQTSCVQSPVKKKSYFYSSSSAGARSLPRHYYPFFGHCLFYLRCTLYILCIVCVYIREVHYYQVAAFAIGLQIRTITKSVLQAALRCPLLVSMYCPVYKHKLYPSACIKQCIITS